MVYIKNVKKKEKKAYLLDVFALRSQPGIPKEKIILKITIPMICLSLTYCRHYSICSMRVHVWIFIFIKKPTREQSCEKWIIKMQCLEIVQSALTFRATEAIVYVHCFAYSGRWWVGAPSSQQCHPTVRRKWHLKSFKH